MTLTEFQDLIRDTFGAKDAARGTAGTFMWFMEEVGELAEALRGNRPKAHTAAEFADVLEWLATLATIADVNLDEAVRAKYGSGCPEVHRLLLVVVAAEKP